MKRTALVVTVSDRVAGGDAADESGPALTRRLEELGFDVGLEVVPDDGDRIARAITGAGEPALIVTTGGTGFAPRDVTPQTVRGLLDYEAPGFGEVMRAEGRRSTPLADLSRSLAGVRGRTLVVCLPGSPRGALESIDALAPLLDHALATLREEAHEHPVDVPADDALH